MRHLRFMHVLLAVALAVALAGCGDDGGSGEACTGAVYDPCTDNAQCTSNNCHLYQQQGLQVCVTTCTAGDNSTCPVDESGANGMCNNMGICRPAAANTCER